jgi:ATP-binding protein involved in chromosome partitioning
LGVPFLGELPIVRELREGSDRANPLVVSLPRHPVTAAFDAIAARVIEQVEHAP